MYYDIMWCCAGHHVLLCWGVVVLQVVALQGVMGLPEEQASAQLIIERCVGQQLGPCRVLKQYSQDTLLDLLASITFPAHM
jgi:hypothetical protein